MRRLLVAAGALAGLAAGGPADGAALTVGAKADVRHRVLAELTAVHLRAAGLSARVAPGYSATILHAARADGAIDLAWESVGIALMRHDGIEPARMTGWTTAEAVQRLREAAATAVAWPVVARARGGRAVMVRSTTAAAMKTRNIAALQERLRARGGRLGVSSGFAGRADGLLALIREHGRPWPIRRLPRPRLHGALAGGRLAAATLPVNDARTAAAPLVRLADAAGAFPPHRLVAGVRRPVLGRHPGLKTVIERVGRMIDGAALRRLTGWVRNGTAPDTAARRFLATRTLKAVRVRQTGSAARSHRPGSSRAVSGQPVHSPLP